MDIITRQEPVSLDARGRLVIELTPEQVEHGEDLGNERQDEAEQKNRGGGNNYQGDRAQQRRDHILGALAEEAFAVIYPRLKWHRHNIGGVDFADFIDVKGRRLSFHELIVPTDAVRRAWAYPLFLPRKFPSSFVLMGWAWGFQLLDRKRIESFQPDRPTYVLDHDELHTKEELDSVLRWRDLL